MFIIILMGNEDIQIFIENMGDRKKLYLWFERGVDDDWRDGGIEIVMSRRELCNEHESRKILNGRFPSRTPGRITVTSNATIRGWLKAVREEMRLKCLLP